MCFVVVNLGILSQESALVQEFPKCPHVQYELAIPAQGGGHLSRLRCDLLMTIDIHVYLSPDLKVNWLRA